MLQSPALEVKEAALAAGVHHLQNECAAFAGGNVKIVVVFAGQRSRADFERVDIASQANCLVERHLLRDLRGRDHGYILWHIHKLLAKDDTDDTDCTDLRVRSAYFLTAEARRRGENAVSRRCALMRADFVFRSAFVCGDPRLSVRLRTRV